MKNMIITITCLVSILFSQNIQAIDVNIASNVVAAPEELDQSCLDEYAIRNKFLKKFVFWAPPTLIVSLPVGSFAYFMSLYALMLIAPYEALILHWLWIVLCDAPQLSRRQLPRSEVFH